MNVYKLDHDVNTYEVFGLFNKDDWDIVDMLGKRDRVGSSWPSLRVRPRAPSPPGPRLQGDFPYLGSIIPILSERAVEELRDVLESNGEVLPLDCTDGTYYAYNILTAIDALDEEKSDVERFPSSGRIMLVNRYEFFSEKLEDAVLFTLSGRSKANVFVTDEFVTRVHQAGLLGFEFRRVWCSTHDMPVYGDI